MKKTISILTSLLIIFSFTLSAQTVASNSDKKTNDTEYSKSEVKENKKSKGFNPLTIFSSQYFTYMRTPTNIATAALEITAEVIKVIKYNIEITYLIFKIGSRFILFT